MRVEAVVKVDEVVVVVEVGAEVGPWPMLLEAVCLTSRVCRTVPLFDFEPFVRSSGVVINSSSSGIGYTHTPDPKHQTPISYPPSIEVQQKGRHSPADTP